MSRQVSIIAKMLVSQIPKVHGSLWEENVLGKGCGVQIKNYQDVFARPEREAKEFRPMLPESFTEGARSCCLVRPNPVTIAYGPPPGPAPPQRKNAPWQPLEHSFAQGRFSKSFGMLLCISCLVGPFLRAGIYADL